MTLHVAGRYALSNSLLEQAEEEIEDLYTRRVRTEVKAFLTSDSTLPYEGQPFEHVLVNLIKALNYSLMGNWDEALVEARRVDHLLTVLADQVDDTEQYHDDAFARYLSGILYEVTNDLNNAFIAYRNAYESYTASRKWSSTPTPNGLKQALLRVTQVLRLDQEHRSYQQAFSDITWRPRSELKDLAEVIVMSYNGRAPRTVDQFLDLPISVEALQLVLLVKTIPESENTSARRVAESMLYGLNGRVVRVGLPTLVPQKTQVRSSTVTLTGMGNNRSIETELVADVTAKAQKAMEDRYVATVMKAVARAAVKFALVEATCQGLDAATTHEHDEKKFDWAQVFAGLGCFAARTAAAASEEADTRSWRTLPDEIHLGRLWVPPGQYHIRIRSHPGVGQGSTPHPAKTVTLRKGETRLFIERVIQ